MHDSDSLDLVIDAQPSTVFPLLVSPAQIARWLGRGATLSGDAPGAELRVAFPNGDVAAGALVEAEPDRRAVYSWGYEGAANGIAAGSTKVTIELRPIDQRTEVSLRHEGLDADQRRAHFTGWRHYLGTLAAAATDDELRPLAGRAVDDYFAAWREADPAGRVEILRRCWSEDAAFRDASSLVEGLDALSAHIQGALAFIPGVSLVHDGRLTHCQGFVQFGWNATMGDTVLAHGTNFGRVSREGRFAFVVGM